MKERILRLKVSRSLGLTDLASDNVEFLTTFTFPSFEQPPQPWPTNPDFTAGSIAAADPLLAQISLSYDYDKFVSERMNSIRQLSDLK